MAKMPLRTPTSSWRFSSSNACWRRSLGELQNNSARQDAELNQVNARLQQLSAQLEDTVTRLKRRLGWLSGLK